jgi:hypothetical protein
LAIFLICVARADNMLLRLRCFLCVHRADSFDSTSLCYDCASSIDWASSASTSMYYDCASIGFIAAVLTAPAPLTTNHYLDTHMLSEIQLSAVCDLAVCVVYPSLSLPRRLHCCLPGTNGWPLSLCLLCRLHCCCIDNNTFSKFTSMCCSAQSQLYYFGVLHHCSTIEGLYVDVLLMPASPLLLRCAAAPASSLYYFGVLLH